MLSSEQVKSLADLPTLPVMRAMLLGTVMASATKLVRTWLNPPVLWLRLSKPSQKKERLLKALPDRKNCRKILGVAGPR